MSKSVCVSATSQPAPSGRSPRWAITCDTHCSRTIEGAALGAARDGAVTVHHDHVTDSNVQVLKSERSGTQEYTPSKPDASGDGDGFGLKVPTPRVRLQLK